MEAFKGLIPYPHGEMGSILRQRESLWIVYNVCIGEPESAGRNCLLWVSKPLPGQWLDILNVFPEANFLGAVESPIRWYRGRQKSFSGGIMN